MSDNAPTNRGHRPPEDGDKRSMIVDAALQVLTDKGYHETRIADVAAVLGISPGLVMYYFKTKESLLAATTAYAEDRWYGEVEQRLTALPTAAAKLQEMILLTCVFTREDERDYSWSLWLDLWTQAMRWPEIRDVRQNLDQHWRGKIHQVVGEGIASGEFSATAEEADAFTVIFASLLDGFAVQIALNDPTVTIQVAVKQATDVIRRYLDPGKTPQRQFDGDRVNPS